MAGLQEITLTYNKQSVFFIVAGLQNRQDTDCTIFSEHGNIRKWQGTE